MFLVLLSLPLFDLVFAGLLNGCLELRPPGLLLLKESLRFLFGLCHLLVQDLLLLVLDLRQVHGLFLDHLLPDVLLLPEPLRLPVLLELVHVLLLLRVLVHHALVLLLLPLLLLLVGLQFLISFVELLSCPGLLGSPLELLQAGGLEVLPRLPLDQLALHNLFLQLLNIGHLSLMQLILYHLGCVLLPFVHLFESLLHAFVVLLHLGDIILYPSVLERPVLLDPPLLELDLRVPLLQHIAHQHLRVEGLHLVLRVIGLLSGLLQGLPTLLLVESLLLLVNTSSCKLKK